MAGGVSGVSFASFIGPCWRAVPAGQDAKVLEGTTRAGRYNRPGQRTLYMSSSPEGVAAAMARYGKAERVAMKLSVIANRLADLRDADTCAAWGLDTASAKTDWIAALARGDEPLSWRVADRAREIEAEGLIEGSRRLPGAWHLILFRWNKPGTARVEVLGR